MNIDNFEKNNPLQDDSTALEHAHQLRQKIENKKNRQKKLKMILGGLVALVVLLTLATGYSQYKLYKLAKDEQVTGVTNPPKTGEEVLAALGKHILLPQGNPQIAEIQDVAKLKETQAFFKDAQNGDIVVVYETTIFIYRPSADIVVAAGDISGANQANP